MTEAEMIKSWVVMNATVTRPTKNIWSASVTIMGYDENGLGSSIERAYKALASDLFINKDRRKHIIEKLNK